MVAGRKPQTFQVKVNAPYTPNLNSILAATRNLSKSQLGGVIFGCKNLTHRECLYKQLFGLPSQHFSYVKNIEPGLPLFLFNYSERKLHGIYEAASHGQMNINPYAWTTNGSEKTQYPAQVQIRVQQRCQPLLEEQFKPIIADNYYCRNHFWFELDHTQTAKLMSLLAANLAAPPTTYLPHDKANWSNMFQSLPSTGLKGEGEGFKSLAPEMDDSIHSSEKLDACVYFDELKVADEGFKLSASEVEHFSQSSGKSDSTDFSRFDSLETHVDAKTSRQDDKDIILAKLTELAQKRKNQDVSLISNTLMKETNFEDLEQMDLVQKNEDSACSSSRCQFTIARLVQGMEELKAFKAEQCVKMIQMEQKLVAAEMEIQRLKDRCLMLESLSNHSVEQVDQKVASEMETQQLNDCCPMLESLSMHSVEHVNEKVVDLSEEMQLDPTESIFLVGGYDGESWLSALNSYFPSQDVIKSVQPMSSVRSYASAAQLNGEIYVFGGGDGYSWYDTVESYNPSSDRWTLCPLLKEKKGSLAGAAVDEKIFAIGGGNGIGCFSNVEMLDLIVGRWIYTRSMLQKRFALAAVELNGSIYATGGYDGISYLESAERFDPREHSWSTIASMSTKRGCHSMVVLNEKLYAIGGFDGDKMVSSVEIFDPRMGSWMVGDPINQPRGYAAAAVVKGSIYIVGGLRAGEDIIDTVEYFKEGEGWQEKTTKAVGKRCFLSAVALKS